MHKPQKWKNRKGKFQLIKIQQCNYVIAIMTFILIYMACSEQLLSILLVFTEDLIEVYHQ